VTKDEDKKGKDFNKNFSGNLKHYREAREISQTDFAHDVGCSVTYLSEVENNKRKISLQLASRMSSRLKVPLDAMIRELNKDNSKQK